MKSYLYGMIINLQFFSTIPLRVEVPMKTENIEKAIRLFPIFGVFQGLIYSCVLYLLINWTDFSAIAIAFVLWLLLIVISGGIHLDGWMDSNDAFFSYQDKEKRLEVMDDPRIGAFGVISVIILLSARFLFIYEIVERLGYSTYIMVIFIPFLGKTLMGWMLTSVPTAKQKGLGYLFQQAKKPKTTWIYPIYIGIAILLISIWQIDFAVTVGAMIIAIVFLFLYLRSKVVRWFGGITGDVVGAATEGAEVFLWMTLWLFHYYGMG